MFGKVTQWIHRKERDFHDSFGGNITDPKERKRSWRHYLWLDHGVLRFKWHNFAEVAPGVYRSNHPHHERFAAYRDMGIKTVLNLRAAEPKSPYLFEEESCAALGLDLVTVPMSARRLPTRQTLLDLFAAFDTIAHPFMMHCKSGADRTGLASALFLLDKTNADAAEVRDQLSFRYIHIRKSSTGVLDFLLETYLARQTETGIGIRDWVATEYDMDAVDAAYQAKKASERFWQGWR